MTSGQFHSVPLSSITVLRDNRQRRKLDGIPDLAESIGRIGLIHPLVVTRESVLVAGERRLEAVKSLGWISVPCQYTDEVEPEELRAIELEENIKRKDIPWQDQCRAVLEFHSIRLGKDPSWTQEATGKALGIHQTTVAQHIKIAQEILRGDQQVTSAGEYSTAKGIVERRESRQRAAEEEAFFSASAPAHKEPKAESILHADFTLWAPTYSGPRFNFIHCDFPYGIGADKHVQGAADTHGGYDDSEEVYWNLCHSLSNNLERLCADSCHIIFWFSLHYYQDTLTFFNKSTNFIVDLFPLIWLKSDNSGIIPDPERGPRRIYETALFGSRGDRKIVRSKSNGYPSPSVKDDHMSIKSEAMLKYFFEMIVDENTVMLDPTCGSGSALRAAEGLGAKSVLGLEANAEFAERAKLALARSRRLREPVLL